MGFFGRSHREQQEAERDAYDRGYATGMSNALDHKERMKLIDYLKMVNESAKLDRVDSLATQAEKIAWTTGHDHGFKANGGRLYGKE